MSIHLPELYEHFIRIEIDIKMFVVQWVMTLFTAIAQFNKKSKFLELAMDLIISGGWLSMVKIIIVVFQTQETQLKNSSFDQILLNSNQLIKNVETMELDLKKEFAKLRISRHHLDFINREYKDRVKKIGDFYSIFENTNKI